MNKTPLFLLIAILFLLISTSSLAFAQSNQNLILKPGFNFVSFSVTPTVSAAAFKSANPSIENIFVYSAAAGSFLSVNEGTLTTLAAGKGYIVKNSNASDLTIAIPGSAPATIGNINLKTGFNLIGFAKTPAAVTFNKLMDVYPIIKGLYKWSTSAGGFIQVIRNESGVPVQLDGINPSFKAGESYFINMTGDTTLNYDGADVIVGSGPPVSVAKSIELTGDIGLSPTTPSYSVSRAIDFSTMRLSVFDEINNSPVEGATITATGVNTFKAILPVATSDRYLSILVKNTDGIVIYKTFLGRVPKATEVTEDTVKITNIKVSDESTARALIVLENRTKIPLTVVIAKKSVDATTNNTDFGLALEEHIAGLEDRVYNLKQAVNLIVSVLTTAGVDSNIKQKVTQNTLSDSTNLLKSYVSLLQYAATLQTVNKITVPAQLTVGFNQINAQSTLTDINKVVTDMNGTIGERVAMPVLNHMPGRYNGEIEITMTCATPNSYITYDFNDGSAAITYTTPLKISKTCVINIVAFRRDWPMSWHSKFISGEYTIGAFEAQTLTSISLSKTTEVMAVTTEKFDLSTIKIKAQYSNGDSKEVQATRWEFNSGPGVYSGTSYYSYSKIGVATFSAIYAEGGIEKKVDFTLSIVDQQSLSQAIITSSGGSLKLANGVIFEVPPGAVNITTEVGLSILPVLGVQQPTSRQTFYKLNTTGAINNSNIKIPIKEGTLEEDVIFTCIDYAQNKAYRIKPIIKDSYCIFTFGDSTSNKVSVNKNLASDITVWTEDDDLSGRKFGEKVEAGGVTFYLSMSTSRDTEDLKRKVAGDNYKPNNFRWPYYRQYWNTCNATTWLMLMKGYKAYRSTQELNPNFDSIFEIFNFIREKGIDTKEKGLKKPIFRFYVLASFMDAHSNYQLEELTKTYNPEMTIKSYECDNLKGLIHLVAEKIQEKKPLAVWSMEHVILICGYEFNGNAFKDGIINSDNIFFYVNNPDSNKPSRRVSADDFLKEIHPASVMKNVTEWSTYKKKKPYICYTVDESFKTPRYLQTIHLSDPNNNEDGGVKLIDNLKNVIASTFWNDQADHPNEIVWIPDSISTIERLANIHFINIPISNSSALANVKVKLSIFKDNTDISGNFTENAIADGYMKSEGNTEELISLGADSLNYYNFKSNTVIVGELVKYIKNNPLTSKFVMRVELYNGTSIMDRFDVKYEYKKPFYIDPVEKILRQGESCRFKSYNENKDVSDSTVWEVTDGIDFGAKITQDGTYTAPSQVGTYNIKATLKTNAITAPGQNNINKAALEQTASAKITVVYAPQINVSSSSLTLYLGEKKTFSVFAEQNNQGMEIESSIQELNSGKIEVASNIITGASYNNITYTAPDKDKDYYDSDGIYHIIIKSVGDPSISKVVNVTVVRPIFEKTTSTNSSGYKFEYGSIKLKNIYDSGEGPYYKENNLHGDYKMYYPSGILSKQGNYVKGKREGLWTCYYNKSNKQICYQGNYYSGISNTGTFKFYNEDGTEMSAYFVSNNFNYYDFVFNSYFLPSPTSK